VNVPGWIAQHATDKHYASGLLEGSPTDEIVLETAARHMRGVYMSGAPNNERPNSRMHPTQLPGHPSDSSGSAREFYPRSAFSPRPDRHRSSLAAIHRQVCEALLVLAIEELIRTNRIEEYQPLRN
jgi:hypothetical protein